MLNLHSLTDDGWFQRIKPHLEIVLLDHTQLEKRAASAAMSMLFRYTHNVELAKLLADVVQEEIEHFTRMLDLLTEKGIEYRAIEPSSYAATLMKATRKKDPEALLDKLLVSGLIEARSCERFRILSENLDDAKLCQFYAELFISEARHHTLYTNIARKEFGDEVVRKRLAELSEIEWQAINSSKGEPRLHSF